MATLPALQPFVMGILMRSFHVFVVISLTKLLNKQLSSACILRLLRPEYSGQTHDTVHVQWEYICLPQVWLSTICDISVPRNDVECKCIFYVFSERFIARVNNHKSHSNPCKYWLPLGGHKVEGDTYLGGSKMKNAYMFQINSLIMSVRPNILSYFCFCRQTTLTTAEWPQTTIFSSCQCKCQALHWEDRMVVFQHICFLYSYYRTCDLSPGIYPHCTYNGCLKCSRENNRPITNSIVVSNPCILISTYQPPNRPNKTSSN